MSASQLTIGGAFNGTTGIVSVPSAFVGAVSTPGSINNLLQDYLNNLTGGVTTGAVSFENNDVMGGLNLTVPGTGSTGFEEFTNTDSVGAVTSGSISGGAYTVSPNVNYLAVEAPGTFSLGGAASTSFALFGANSNVNYSVSNAGPSSIYAAGGTDTVTLRDDGSVPLNDTLFSAGTDTMNLFGAGSVTATSTQNANDFYMIDQTNASITAQGNATVALGFLSQNSGGTLDFINNSTVSATIHASVFSNGTTAANNVTAFGGTGGGYFDGGQKTGSVSNLLVGGAVGSVSVGSTGVITQVSADSTAGAVTLVGGGDGSILDAQGAALNELFAGSGNETLIAASTTGANLFQLGLNYPGLGQPYSNGVVSTQGSGSQNFFLGNSNGASLYGSTAAKALNAYYVYSDATIQGGTFNIFNFTDVTGNSTVGFSGSEILLTNGSGTAGGSASIQAIYQDPADTISGTAGFNTVIQLSDNTTLKLYGVSASSIHTITNSSGITFIL